MAMKRTFCPYESSPGRWAMPAAAQHRPLRPSSSADGFPLLAGLNLNLLWFAGLSDRHLDF